MICLLKAEFSTVTVGSHHRGLGIKCMAEEKDFSNRYLLEIDIARGCLRSHYGSGHKQPSHSILSHCQNGSCCMTRKVLFQAKHERWKDGLTPPRSFFIRIFRDLFFFLGSEIIIQQNLLRFSFILLHTLSLE